MQHVLAENIFRIKQGTRVSDHLHARKEIPTDRDHFIITVYCLVCEHYQALALQQHIRRGGFAPALTDEEVITIKICGEYLKAGRIQCLHRLHGPVAVL